MRIPDQIIVATIAAVVAIAVSVITSVLTHKFSRQRLELEVSENGAQNFTNYALSIIPEPLKLPGV